MCSGVLHSGRKIAGLPTAGYAALLEMRADGFVRQYPGLWVAEW